MKKWVLSGIATILVINLYSTYLVDKAKNIYPHHGEKYIIYIWLLPVLGFLIALFRTSMQYPKRPSPEVTDRTAIGLDNIHPGGRGQSSSSGR